MYFFVRREQRADAPGPGNLCAHHGHPDDYPDPHPDLQAVSPHPVPAGHQASG